MPTNTLAHSPADVLCNLLVELEVGSDSESGEEWPVYVSGEPAGPDDRCITVYDTQGRSIRLMIGQLLTYYGFQVRVRSDVHRVGWEKTDAIRKALAEDTYQETIAVDDARYLVHCIANIGEVLSLGKDSGSSRNLFTLNAVAAIRQLT